MESEQMTETEAVQRLCEYLRTYHKDGLELKQAREVAGGLAGDAPGWGRLFEGAYLKVVGHSGEYGFKIDVRKGADGFMVKHLVPLPDTVLNGESSEAPKAQTEPESERKPSGGDFVVHVGGGNSKAWNALRKSSKCLFWYLNESGRQMLQDSCGKMHVECPSFKCHNTPVSRRFFWDGEDFVSLSEQERREISERGLTATVYESKDGKPAFVRCHKCEGEWDLSRFYKADHKCESEAEAIAHFMRDFMDTVPLMLLDGDTLLRTIPTLGDFKK